MRETYSAVLSARLVEYSNKREGITYLKRCCANQKKVQKSVVGKMGKQPTSIIALHAHAR